MANWFIDCQLDMMWLIVIPAFSWTLVSTSVRFMVDIWTKTGSLFLKYKARISMQADDDSIVSWSTLRYRKHTQHTAFFKHSGK